jgi:hypothetical protein
LVRINNVDEESAFLLQLSLSPRSTVYQFDYVIAPSLSIIHEPLQFFGRAVIAMAWLLNLFQHFHGDYGKKPHLNPPAWVDVSSRLCHDHMTAAWARYHPLATRASGTLQQHIYTVAGSSGLLTACYLDYPISLPSTAIEIREHGGKSPQPVLTLPR